MNPDNSQKIPEIIRDVLHQVDNGELIHRGFRPLIRDPSTKDSMNKKIKLDKEQKIAWDKFSALQNLPEKGLSDEDIVRELNILNVCGPQGYNPLFAPAFPHPTIPLASLLGFIVGAKNMDNDLNPYSLSSKVEEYAVDILYKGLGRTAQPNETIGFMTSGGTSANFAGMYLNFVGQFAEKNGVKKGAKLVEDMKKRLRRPTYRNIVRNKSTHFSADKSEAWLNAKESLLDYDFSDGLYNPSLDFTKLDKILSKLDTPKRNTSVFLTAGTTDCGFVDPIEEVLDVADKYNVPVHVDTAFGYIAALNSETRNNLKGIERCSGAADVHKGIGCFPAGVAFIHPRYREVLDEIFVEKNENYITVSAIHNMRLEGSYAGSSAYGALMAFRSLGKDGLEQFSLNAMHEAQKFADGVRDMEFETMPYNSPRTPVVAFSYDAGNKINATSINETNKKTDTLHAKLEKTEYNFGDNKNTLGCTNLHTLKVNFINPYVRAEPLLEQIDLARKVA